MSHPGSLVLLVPVLLLSTGALAQLQDAKQWKRVERSVSLKAGAEESTLELRLAPSVVTTVLFDTDIDAEAVDVEPLRGLFSRVDVEARLLVLRPTVAMPAKGVPPLVVRFADGAAPRRLVLALTTDEREVDSVVDVLRQPAPAEELEARLVALRNHCEALEARLAAARRPALPRGLADAILSGAIEEEGVRRSKVEIGATSPTTKGLLALRLVSYRSRQWLALGMKLENPVGSSPWVPGLARLTRLDAEGRPSGGVLEAPVRMRAARLAPGQGAQAVVQWQWSADSEVATYALEVLDATGRRGVRWPTVEL